jgi:WhiB family redox-sensing transcriptional regulator
VVHVGRLPVPTTAAWEWQLQAACRKVNSSFFFHPWGERGAARNERIRRAKEVCAECPVIDACRRHALEVQEQYGVWGGLSEEERLVILNRVRPSLRRKLLAQASDSHPLSPADSTRYLPTGPDRRPAPPVHHSLITEPGRSCATEEPPTRDIADRASGPVPWRTVRHEPASTVGGPDGP